MQQRDLIKDQIEQLGKVLGKVVTLIVGLDNGGDILGTIEEVTVILETELQIDFKKIMGLEQEEFQKAIKEKFQAQEMPLATLGNLLFEIAKRCGPEGELRQQYLAKALWTFEYVNEISTTFSMERMSKINSIKKMIKTEQRFIYHFVLPDYWQQQVGAAAYFPSDYAEEGFIHCCTKNQWEHVRTSYYKGVPIIKVLKLDTDKLKVGVKYEGKTAEKFPHIYGGINKEAIVEIITITQA